MTHEKIIKRSDGTRYKIIVLFYSNGFGRCDYSITVKKCEPGKRTFSDVVDTDSFSFRKLSLPDRGIYEHLKHLEHVSDTEILQAKIELWIKLKPQ